MNARNWEGKTSAGCLMRIVGFQVRKNSSGKRVWFSGDHVRVSPVRGRLGISSLAPKPPPESGERKFAKAEGSNMKSQCSFMKHFWPLASVSSRKLENLSKFSRRACLTWDLSSSVQVLTCFPLYLKESQFP